FARVYAVLEGARPSTSPSVERELSRRPVLLPLVSHLAACAVAPRATRGGRASGARRARASAARGPRTRARGPSARARSGPPGRHGRGTPAAGTPRRLCAGRG